MAHLFVDLGGVQEGVRDFLTHHLAITRAQSMNGYRYGASRNAELCTNLGVFTRRGFAREEGVEPGKQSCLTCRFRFLAQSLQSALEHRRGPALLENLLG